MELAETSRKRKKRRRKRKKGKRPGGAAPPPGAPPTVQAKHKHVLGYTDPGDGLVREQVAYRDAPQPPGEVPPRPLPRPQPATAPLPPQPMGTYSGQFGRVQAKRLLDRAGFGPYPGQAEAWAELGLETAVHLLTRLNGTGQLHGPAPTDDDGAPLAPADSWGHDHLWWLDRMVRTDAPLVERMALVLHDWFATSNAAVDRQQQLIDQSWLFRNGCFGSFLDLTVNVTKDPAMLQWLNGNENRRGAPNENYARELMELFTLGADRGAYTEDDIREAARALTGWRNSWSPELGAHNFRFDPTRHDNTNKTIFGRAGNWNWDDAPRLCLEHPLHPSFFVGKLWRYFIPQAPSADTLAALESVYVSSGYAIRPVLEAILMHPDLYLGPPMIKPPVVYLASLLRAIERPVDTESWHWICEEAGQLLFWPPNVSGWDDERWLDTSRTRARWLMITYAAEDLYVDPWNDPYDAAEAPEPALDKALAHWGYPPLRVEQHDELLRFSRNAWTGVVAGWQQAPARAMRQNALRQLIAISSDLQLC
ncbi:MAG: DUF1800 domain-containing protein [Solirubrobacterales bacterium]